MKTFAKITLRFKPDHYENTPGFISDSALFCLFIEN